MEYLCYWLTNFPEQELLEKLAVAQMVIIVPPLTDTVWIGSLPRLQKPTIGRCSERNKSTISRLAF
jgi:hypothetical protein